jgi:uncharacterized protein YbaR (Trm112 family)
LACLHCGGTLASVWRDRQFLEARSGYPCDCVCCDCETGNACPQCHGENLDYESYDGGTAPETGYYCRDCGTSGYVEDTAPALVMLPQPRPASASLPAELPEVGMKETFAANDRQSAGVSLETKYLHLRQPVPLEDTTSTADGLLAGRLGQAARVLRGHAGQAAILGPV